MDSGSSRQHKLYSSIPYQRDIEIPLLSVIADAGGELPVKDAVKLVTLEFPNLTTEDLERMVPSGKENYWINRIRWVRQALADKGELDPSAHGMWRITEKGRVRLEQARRPASTTSTSPVQLVTAQDSRLVKDEAELYDPMVVWLNVNWGKNVKDCGDDYWVRVTATQSRKGQLGKWSRPDVTSIQVSRFDVLPQRSIEVKTFEIKRFTNTDLTSVYEAASHQRWAHHTYLVIEIPDKNTPMPEYLTTESARFGVGLLKMYTKHGGAEYELEEVVGPKRQDPDPKELDGMLVDFFSYSAKELRRFKDLIK